MKYFVNEIHFTFIKYVLEKYQLLTFWFVSIRDLLIIILHNSPESNPWKT